MTSTAEVQIFNLEVPLMQQDFLQWRNLLAKNAEAITDSGPEQIAQVSSVPYQE